jgi:hypothetical protein
MLKDTAQLFDELVHFVTQHGYGEVYTRDPRQEVPADYGFKYTPHVLPVRSQSRHSVTSITTAPQHHSRAVGIPMTTNGTPRCDTNTSRDAAHCMCSYQSAT